VKIIFSKHCKKFVRTKKVIIFAAAYRAKFREIIGNKFFRFEILKLGYGILLLPMR
jgi:hypothetical protein